LDIKYVFNNTNNIYTSSRIRHEKEKLIVYQMINKLIIASCKSNK